MNKIDQIKLKEMDLMEFKKWWFLKDLLIFFRGSFISFYGCGAMGDVKEPSLSGQFTSSFSFPPMPSRWHSRKFSNSTFRKRLVLLHSLVWRVSVVLWQKKEDDRNGLSSRKISKNNSQQPCDLRLPKSWEKFLRCSYTFKFCASKFLSVNTL